MGFGRHIDLRFNPIFDSANVGNDWMATGVAYFRQLNLNRIVLLFTQMAGADGWARNPSRGYGGHKP